MKALVVAVLALGCLCGPVTAADSVIGNFLVKHERDPFGDADTYVAILTKDGNMFAIRCLSGELSVAFTLQSKADEGDVVELKRRVDNDPVEDALGGVIATARNSVIVQTANEAFVRRLGRAKTVAFRGTVNSIFATSTFEMRGADRVVAGALRACKL